MPGVKYNHINIFENENGKPLFKTLYIIILGFCWDFSEVSGGIRGNFGPITMLVGKIEPTGLLSRDRLGSESRSGKSVVRNIWALFRREILCTLTNTFPHSNVNGLSVFYPSPVSSIALVTPMKDPSKQEGSIGRHMVTNLAKT